MALTGNLETARKMFFGERVMLILAYAVIYACGIVYLTQHWKDISTGKQGKFLTVLSEKNEYLTDATYFAVGYIIFLPWLTSTYCAYAKIADDW